MIEKKKRAYKRQMRLRDEAEAFEAIKEMFELRSYDSGRRCYIVAKEEKKRIPYQEYERLSRLLDWGDETA